MAKMKEPHAFFIEKGDIIFLQVGCDRNGYSNFIPVFLEKDRWAPGPSLRIFRPTKGVKKPELAAGEEWTAKVVGCRLGKGHTHDGRSRVIVFLDNFQRVEYEVKRVSEDEQHGWREIWSGTHQVAVSPSVALKAAKDEYLDSDQVVVVHKYYEMNKGLFKTSTERHPLSVYQRMLREAGIDTTRYFKKMRPWRGHLKRSFAA